MFDVILVGGGLQSALIALAVLARQPGARVAIVERASRLGDTLRDDDIAPREPVLA